MRHITSFFFTTQPRRQATPKIRAYLLVHFRKQQQAGTSVKPILRGFRRVVRLHASPHQDVLFQQGHFVPRASQSASHRESTHTSTHNHCCLLAGGDFCNGGSLRGSDSVTRKPGIARTRAATTICDGPIQTARQGQSVRLCCGADLDCRISPKTVTHDLGVGGIVRNTYYTSPNVAAWWKGSSVHCHGSTSRHPNMTEVNPLRQSHAPPGVSARCRALLRTQRAHTHTGGLPLMHVPVGHRCGACGSGSNGT